jgi:hypothetical protein
MKAILISGKSEFFQAALTRQLNELQLLPHEFINIQYSSVVLQDRIENFIVHSALIIYNRKNEPATTTEDDNRHNQA